MLQALKTHKSENAYEACHFPSHLIVLPYFPCMATSHSKKMHDLEEFDPRWKSYPLRRKQSQVFDEKVPIYLNQSQRLNPWLVSWKHIKQEDQISLVALQNTLIRDIFDHIHFDQGNLIDLKMHSRKEWEVCPVNRTSFYPF